MSKGALQKRLGDFAPAPAAVEGERTDQVREYEKAPSPRYKQHSPLFTEYQEARTNREKLLQDRLTQIAAEQEAEIRNVNGVSLAGRMTRHVFIGKTAMRKQTREIKAKYAAVRRDVYQQYGRRGWLDWLREEAKNRRAEALFALRVKNKVLTGLTIGGVRKINDALADFAIDSVTRSGTVIYRVGGDTIRDDGERFQLAANSAESTIAAALDAAIIRHGGVLSLSGTDDFKERVIRVAAKRNLPVKFKDPALDARRESIFQVNLQKQGKGRTIKRDNAKEKGKGRV
jgi:hypothetical protein